LNTRELLLAVLATLFLVVEVIVAYAWGTGG
jgi:hypothetical protein